MRIRPALLLLALAAACSTDDPAATADLGAADTGTVPDTGAPSDDVPDVADDDTGASDDAGATGDTSAVDDAGPDVADAPDTTTAPVCEPLVSECESALIQRVCRADGSAWDTMPCQGSDVCLDGACGAPVCTPGEIVCQGAQRALCDDIGSGYLPLPCPPGFGCSDGTCQRVRANIVLIVDTSGSMDFSASTTPGSCLATPCAGFPFPTCENPAAPSSRLGVAKVALQQLFASKVLDGARLALQRFPQRGSNSGSCQAGYYYDVGDVTCDNDAKHELSNPCLDAALGEYIVVPFNAANGVSDPAALSEWVDFNESVAVGTQACQWDTDCPSWICKGGFCAEHTNNELRPTGGTPLGKALYYAGEYLRLRMLLEGKPCTSEAECASSPDHHCVEGVCHDPFHGCRQNAIVLFTDGEETAHPDFDDFWNPWVQAKRLHFGLGCTADVQCANGATCEFGVCTPLPESAPSGLCSGSFKSCSVDSDCPDTFCGGPNPCPGDCTQPDVDFVDPLSKNYLKAWSGYPLPLTVHVADASGGTSVSNAMVAAWGGGKHVLVDFEDIDGLFEALYDLVDLKQGNACQ